MNIKLFISLYIVSMISIAYLLIPVIGNWLFILALFIYSLMVFGLILELLFDKVYDLWFNFAIEFMKKQG